MVLVLLQAPASAFRRCPRSVACAPSTQTWSGHGALRSGSNSAASLVRRTEVSDSRLRIWPPVALDVPCWPVIANHCERGATDDKLPQRRPLVSSVLVVVAFVFWNRSTLWLMARTEQPSCRAAQRP